MKRVPNYKSFTCEYCEVYLRVLAMATEFVMFAEGAQRVAAAMFAERTELIEHYENLMRSTYCVPLDRAPDKGGRGDQKEGARGGATPWLLYKKGLIYNKNSPAYNKSSPAYLRKAAKAGAGYNIAAPKVLSVYYTALAVYYTAIRSVLHGTPPPYIIQARKRCRQPPRGGDEGRLGLDPALVILHLDTCCTMPTLRYTNAVRPNRPKRNQAVRDTIQAARDAIQTAGVVMARARRPETRTRSSEQATTRRPSYSLVRGLYG